MPGDGLEPSYRLYQRRVIASILHGRNWQGCRESNPGTDVQSVICLPLHHIPTETMQEVDTFSSVTQYLALNLVPEDRIELSTHALSRHRSTTELPGHNSNTSGRRTGRLSIMLLNLVDQRGNDPRARHCKCPSRPMRQAQCFWSSLSDSNRLKLLYRSRLHHQSLESINFCSVAKPSATLIILASRAMDAYAWVVTTNSFWSYLSFSKLRSSDSSSELQRALNPLSGANLNS